MQFPNKSKMKEITASSATTALSGSRPLHHRINHADRPYSFGADGKDILGGSPSRPFRVGVIPLVFELYDRIVPDLRARIQQFFSTVVNELQIENVEFLPCELVSNLSHMKQVCQNFENQTVDTIIITHLSYVPSGQLLSALTSIDTPILLWPAQPLERIEAEEFDALDVLLNHSVHGTMDLANMLRRAKRLCSVVHGHWKEPAFQRNLLEWFQVNAMLQAIRSVNPLVLGERFPDMLDLRLENEPL